MSIQPKIRAYYLNSSAHQAGSGRRLVAAVLLLLAVTASSRAATDTWTGGAAPDGTWTNALNWGGVAPNATGDNLIFSGSAQPFTTNNTAVTSAGWILFNPAVAFTNYGTAVTVTAGYTNAAFNNQWSTALALGASQSFDVAAGTTNVITGGISGSGMAITKTSPGKLVFTSGNTYNGGTSISNGVLQLNSSTAAGPTGSAVAVATNATLNVVQGGNYSYVYTGSGNINIVTATNTSIGDNTTQLGTSTGLPGFFGTIFVVPTNNPGTGTTKFSDNANLTPATTIVIATTNGEYFNNGGASSPSFIVGSPNQGPMYAGAAFGRVRLNGNSTLSGPLFLNGDSSIGGNGGSGTYAGVISDGGLGHGIIVVDNNTLTLSASNTYSGYSAVTNGTLRLAATGSISNSSVILLDVSGNFDVTLLTGGFWLTGTQAISGVGTVKGNINVPSTASIIPGGNCVIPPGGLGLGHVGVGLVGTLKFNNGLSFNGGSPITFDLADNVGLPSDKITVAGAVTNNGNTTILLNYLSPFPHAGTYTLMTYGSTNGPGTFVLGGANATNVTLNVGATALTLTVTNIYQLTNIVWHGDGTANSWDLTTANWLNGGVPATFPSSSSGDVAVFDDSGSATPAINLTYNPAPGGVVMSNNVNSYEFTGSGVLNGNMSLTLDGTGSVTINNSNSYTGGSIINSGTLQVGTNGSSGVISGAVLDNAQVIYDHSNTDVVNSAISGPGAVTIVGSGQEVFSATSTMTYSGGTTIASNATLKVINPIAGVITNYGTLNAALTGSGQVNFNNVITGVGGTITGTATSGVSVGIIGTLINFSGTINAPPGTGGYKLVFGGGAGQFNATLGNNTNVYTMNITNGATVLLQTSTPLGMQVNISGYGNGENLGALRLDNCSTYGPVNLQGPAAIGCFQQYTGSILDGISDTNAAGVSQGYGVVIENGRIVFNTVFPSYGGNTTISNGTLVLVNTILTNSPEIDIASLATLDVSAISGFGVPYYWPGALPTQTLGGISTNGYIVGNITMNAGGSLSVACSTNGLPALVMTNDSTLTFNDNPVKIVVSGPPLPAGVYPLVVSAADGSAVVGSVAGSTITVAGSGLAPGATDSLSISNSAIYLTVNAPAVFGGVSVLPDNNVQLTFSGPNGLGYSVHATTNLEIVPVSSWPVISTGTFGAGPVMFTDLNATNYPQQFYIITVP